MDGIWKEINQGRLDKKEPIVWYLEKSPKFLALPNLPTWSAAAVWLVNKLAKNSPLEELPRCRSSINTSPTGRSNSTLFWKNFVIMSSSWLRFHFHSDPLTPFLSMTPIIFNSESFIKEILKSDARSEVLSNVYSITILIVDS